MIETLPSLVGEIVAENDKITMDGETVQATAIVGLVALGTVAMVIDGNIGETIAIAVAAGLGGVVTAIFKDKRAAQ